jgi:hypothetical protein
MNARMAGSASGLVADDEDVYVDCWKELRDAR